MKQKLKRIVNHIDRRINRGCSAWSWLFHGLDLADIWFGFLAIILIIIMSPILFLNYGIGAFCEWRDNHRDGVRSVRD